MDRSPAPVEKGEVIAGKYRVEDVLGAGGMGVVVAATHLQLGQRVALKFVRPSAAGDRVLAERFLREARASFRLRSEHTVRVLDVGELPGGVPFMVMELLEGQDLRELLNARRRLPEGEAADILLQALGAVEEAHACGVVHRDLKPRNLFLTRRVDGTTCVKVLDFGISKIQGEEREGGPLTSPEIALGSPRYMAPEQWRSSAGVDGRADLYALGIILYEMLTGEPPLKHLPLGELVRRVVAGAIPSPRDFVLSHPGQAPNADVSEAINKVVLKALRPRPEERFQSAALFATELRAAVAATTTAPMRGRSILSTTAATAVVPGEVLAARARLSRAVEPATPSEGPATRREVPLRVPSASHGDRGVTAASPGAMPAKPDMATLTSSAPPPELALAFARRGEPARVEEVRFDDKTTVDPPSFAQAPLPGPFAGHAAAVAPAPLFQPVPVAPVPVAVQLVATAQAPPRARSAGVPTWAWVVGVLVAGFVLGGGLAVALGLR